MARVLNKLTARGVAAEDRPGFHGDGGGLWLQITKTGAKSWIFRYRRGRKTRDMGLGPVHTVTLAEARDKALAARKLLLDGIDPIEHKRAAAAAARLAAATEMTFKKAAERYIADHRTSWRNEKHAAQWESTLATYAYPIIGDLPVAGIDVTLVHKVLEPIWSTKPETASRVRGRMEAVLDRAIALGYRDGDNPARWKGHLSNILPARSKVRRVNHHSALPYAEVAAFMAKLREQDSIAARALEFAILTAGRTGEVLGATWDEIDLEANVWTVPATRMKAGKDHRVPLSDRAAAILEKMADHGDEGYVFPGAKLLMPE